MVTVTKNTNAARGRKITRFGCLIALGFSLAACSGDGGLGGVLDNIEDAINDVVSTVTIEEQLNNDFEFGLLLERLQQAGLADVLNENNDGLGWTLFAPDQTVFDSDPVFQNLTLAEQIAAVSSFLHSGTLLAAELVPGVITMNDGSEVLIEVSGDGVVTVGGATVIGSDSSLSNGVIHRIDSLITTQ